MEHNLIKLSWLAGIIDGEGCMYARRVKRRGKLGGVETRLDIQATSMAMIDEIATILENNEISYKRGQPKMFNKSTRPAARIGVHRKNSLRNLLILVLPFLVVKKPEAERLLDYLNRSCLVSFYFAEENEIISLVGDMKLLKKVA